MSQTLHAGPPGLSVVRRVEAASMRDTMHAEWTKLRTVSGPAWLLAGAIALIVAVSAAATAAVKCPSGTACPVDTPYLSPIILSVVAGNPVWSHRLERYAPMSAGLTVQDTIGLRGLPISPWGGLGVLAIWAAAAMLAGGLVLRLRDA